MKLQKKSEPLERLLFSQKRNEVKSDHYIVDTESGILKAELPHSVEKMNVTSIKVVWS